MRRRSGPFVSSFFVIVVVFFDDGGEERRRRPSESRPVGGVRSTRGSVARADAGPVDDLEADELAGEAP